MRITRPSPAPPPPPTAPPKRQEKKLFANCNKHMTCLAFMTSCLASMTSCLASTTSCGRGTTSCFASLTSCFAPTSSGPRWTSRRRHSAVFFAALRAAVAHLLPSLSFPAKTNQQGHKAKEATSNEEAAAPACIWPSNFEWLLFTRNWCWQAQQSNFSRRFAPHFPSRAINSTHKRAAAGHLY